jgi:hypothetical protein
MKQRRLKSLVMAGLCMATLTLTSCYSSTFVVGDGPQTGIEEKGKNHFFIVGLAPGKAQDTQAMAQGKSDYRVNVKQTFVDGLLGAITFGIYTPRTVTVTH